MLAAVCCLLALFTAGGCSEEQIRNIDQAAQDANSLIAGGKAILDSPAAALIPLPVRQIMEWCGLGLASAIALWKWLVARGVVKANQSLTQTGKAIVLAIESLEGKQADQVKAAVGDQMTEMAAETPGLTYDQMNAVVDALKAK
ncbi:MAG: hypothetical protein WC378_19415 [Opitutaceae bacterium]